jgi:hypothetical protein
VRQLLLAASVAGLLVACSEEGTPTPSPSLAAYVPSFASELVATNVSPDGRWVIGVAVTNTGTERSVATCHVVGLDATGAPLGTADTQLQPLDAGGARRIRVYTDLTPDDSIDRWRLDCG